MATNLSSVYDLFMMQVTDYRLLELYKTSEEDFENYLEAWLIFSIHDFDNICDQSLVFDEDTKIFTETLTVENKVILSTLMMKHWLQKLVNDVTQMNLHITDRDFKIASEAQNLREKVSYLNTVKEQCSQLLVDYGFSNVNWDEWNDQIFAGT